MNEAISVWHGLSYLDGILFTIWLGVLYYGKGWIDFQFQKKLSDYNK
tara:strand:+ start:314 stop:454 length:141 start_codon:yes stop_codon:yes gene_type:complete